MSYIIVQSNQATISATQNLFDFEVPDYIAGIDMDKSFMNISYTIDTVETNDDLKGVHNFITLFNGIGNTAGNRDAGHGLFNSCLVRNVTLTSQRGGQLESIQRADLINQVKQQFTKNLGDIQGDLHESILNLPMEFNYGANSARNLVTEGTMGTSLDVTRYERTGVMRVNMKDILGLGSSVLNLQQLGALRLHMEANLNKFTLKEVPCFTTADPPVASGGITQYWYANVGATLPVAAANPTSLDFGSSDQMFLSKKNCPFHVGMKVGFHLTQAGDHNTAEEVLIKSMVWEETPLTAGPPVVPGGAKCVVTFSDVILDGAVATTAITAVHMYPIYAASHALNYVKAELVIKTVANPPQARGLRYRTFQTQQDFAAASTTFNRTYDIPGNAVASLICFDTATSGTEFSNSMERNLEQYQLFVDNVGQTDRPVKLRIAPPYSKNPLHGIMFEKCLEVMGLPYKNNLDVLPAQMVGEIIADPTVGGVIGENQIFTAGTHNRVTVLPVIYEGTGARKLLNVDLTKDAEGESLNLAIYQMVERTVDY